MSEQNNSGTEGQGLAVHLLEMFHRLLRTSRVEPRRMEVIETLLIAGKQRLSLVRCGEEHFLVGGNADGVQTIVQLCGEREASTLELGANR